MTARPTRNHRKYGDLILERLGVLDVGVQPGDLIPVPATLKAPVASFHVEHETYAKLCDAADARRLARDDALAVVSDAAATVGKRLDDVADAVVGAKLGKRQSPVKAWSKRSVSAIRAQSYANMAADCKTLLDNMTKDGAAKHVLAHHKLLATGVTELNKALKAYTPAASSFASAMEKRDAALPAWQRALDLFRLHAELAWFDEPETYKAAFAPAPDLVETSKAPKKVKATEVMSEAVRLPKPAPESVG
jgi:hypothetical protein